MLVYDVVTQALSGVDVSSVAKGNGKFWGICAFEGKIYAAPFNASKVLVYDPASKQAYGIEKHK